MSIETPDCPPHLNQLAQEEWNRIAPQLESAGLLTRLDQTALAGYCVAWSRWVDAETKLAELGPVVKSPTGQIVQNPYLSIATKAFETVRKLLAEFGLSPSARTRVNAKTPNPDDVREAILLTPPSRTSSPAIEKAKPTKPSRPHAKKKARPPKPKK